MRIGHVKLPRRGAKIHRYPDRCCAVVIRGMRGPKKHSKILALIRFSEVGLIARHYVDR